MNSSSKSSPLGAIADIAARLDEMIKHSPVSDLDKNMRQSVIAQLARHGLVTREEYEIQVALLDKARAKLARLERKIAELEIAAKAAEKR